MGNRNQAQVIRHSLRWDLQTTMMSLVTFKRVAVGASWDRTMWVFQLAPYLTMDVQVEYMALNDKQVLTWLRLLSGTRWPVHIKILPEI